MPEPREPSPDADDRPTATRANLEVTSDLNRTTGLDAISASDTITAVHGYEILGELGRGGMGVVFKARQIAAGRIVALKMILSGSLSSAAARERFRVEAEAVARLQHPNIVQLFEVGDSAGHSYFSLEFCPGGSLDRRLQGEPLPAHAAAELVEQIARGVAAAHAKGIVHRDLKPANVLLAEDGTPKITDFGLAKKLDEDSGHTRTNAVIGTPSYMAPEQAIGDTKRVGPACDVYALGAILYETLTGRPPFKGASVLDTLEQVRHQEPVPPRQLNGAVPRDLETICLKCLQKQPGKRYATAEELRDDLERFRSGRPIVARPVGSIEKAWKWCRRNPAVAASLLAVGLALAGVLAVLILSGHEVRGANAQLQKSNDELEAERGKLTVKTGELTRVNDDLEKAVFAKGKALDAEKAANAAKAAALWDAKHQEYNLGMLVGGREWQQSNVAAAKQRLDTAPEEFRDWEWYYLSRQLHAGVERVITATAEEEFMMLTFTDAGEVAVVGWSRPAGTPAIGFFRVIDPKTGKQIRYWDSRADFADAEVQSVGCHSADADGNRIVVSVVKKPVAKPRPMPKGQTPNVAMQIRDVRTGKVLATLPNDLLHFYGFSPDGKTLYACSGDRVEGLNRDKMRLLAIAADTGQVVHSLPMPAGGTFALAAIDPTGPRLAIEVRDAAGAQVHILDLAAGREVCRIKSTGTSTWDHVADLKFTSQGRLIVVADMVREYDATTGRWLRTLYRGRARFQLHPAGLFMALGFAKATQVVDFSTGERMLDLPYGSYGNRLRLALSPDRRGAIWSKQSITIVDLTRDYRWTEPLLPQLPSMCQPSADLGYLRVSSTPRAVDGEKPVLKFLDGMTGTPAGELELTGERLRHQSLAAGGLVVQIEQLPATPPEQVLRGRVYRIGGEKPALLGERQWRGPGVNVEVLAVDATGRVALRVRQPDATPNAKGGLTYRAQIAIWDARGGEPVVLEEKIDKASSSDSLGQFSPDGKLLAVAQRLRANNVLDCTLTVWDIATRTRNLEVPFGSERPVIGLAFPPGAGRLFVRRDGRTQREYTTETWNLATGQAEPKFWEGPIPFAFAFDGTGRYFAGQVGDLEDAVLEVWDNTTGKRAWHAAGMHPTATFIGGRRLAALRMDAQVVQTGQVVVFDVATGQELLTLGDAPGWGQLRFDAATGKLACFGRDDKPGGGVQRLRVWDGSPLPVAKP